MKPTTILTFLTAEQIIARAKVFPYWEIRNSQNVFLMAASSANATYKYADNNPRGLSLIEALNEMTEFGKSAEEPYLLVVISMGRQHPQSKTTYAIKLTEDESNFVNIQPLNGGQPNQFVFGGGFTQNQNQGQDFATALAGVEARMSAAYQQQLNEYKAEQDRKELAKEKKELAEKEAKLLELEAKLKEDAEKKQFDWSSVVNGLPQLLNGAVNIYSMATGKPIPQAMPLAGAPTNNATTTTETPSAPIVKKEPKVKFTIESEPENLDHKEEIKTENKNDLFSDLSQEEINALLEAKKAIKAGKLSADELKDVVTNPENFFEEEQETITTTTTTKTEDKQ